MRAGPLPRRGILGGGRHLFLTALATLGASASPASLCLLGSAAMVKKHWTGVPVGLTGMFVCRGRGEEGAGGGRGGGGGGQKGAPGKLGGDSTERVRLGRRAGAEVGVGGGGGARLPSDE